MTARRRAALVGAAAAVLLGLATPAHAETFLSDADARLLASRLAEASRVQGICYGWKMVVTGFSGRLSAGTEEGSNLGVGVPAGGEQCAKSVVLAASVSITAETSELEDSSVWSIEATVPDPPTVSDLAALGYQDTDLIDDDGDQALIGAVLALPRLVADAGQAPALPEATPAAGGPAGQPTGGPRPEVIRQHGGMLIVGGLLLIASVLVLVQVRYRSRLSARSARRRGVRQSTPPATDLPPAEPEPGPPPASPLLAEQPAEQPAEQAASTRRWTSPPAPPPGPAELSGPAEPSGLPKPPGPAGPIEPPAPAASDDDPRPPSS